MTRDASGFPHRQQVIKSRGLRASPLRLQRTAAVVPEDPPSWNAIDLPLLEATALLCSQGEAPDNYRVAASVPNLSDREILDGLARLIARGHLTGTTIGAWQATGPVRVVNLKVTSQGYEALAPTD